MIRKKKIMLLDRLILLKESYLNNWKLINLMLFIRKFLVKLRRL